MPFRNFGNILKRSRRSRNLSTRPNHVQVLATSESQVFPVTIGKDQSYGIQVLYNGLEPTVDIVFVHGLTGSSHETWLHKERNVHWPSQLLGQNIPDARILSFGYDADIVHFWGQASNNRLTNHAEDLVGDFARFREGTETETRPIIFVAHSLGGLVVEHALFHSNASKGDHLKKIEYFTVGIVFLGVPHYGSEVAKWGELASQMTKLVKGTNTDILRVLKPDSEMLRLVEKNFDRVLKSRDQEGSEISITCFYEELSVTGIGSVGKPSAYYATCPEEYTDLVI